MDVRYLKEERTIIDHNGSADQGLLPPSCSDEKTLFFPEPRASFDGIRLFTGSHVVCWKSWMVMDLQYSYHRLYYICGGTARYISEDETVQLKKDHLYLFPTYPHHYRIEHDPEDPLDVLWCHFEMDPLLCNGLIEYDPSDDPEMSSVINVWKRIAEYEQPGNEMYHVTALLMHMLERRVPFLYRIHPFLEVEKYIHEHLDEHMTVSSLAGKFGFSRSYFTREFKKIFNTTPARYIQVIRMSRAAEMLRSGISVDEVCAASGYTDKKVFFRSFKNYHGTTTSYFSNKHKMQP